MKIASNYSNTDWSKCRKPCFQANLTAKLQETLIMQAKKSGKLSELNDQMKRISNWGNPKSSVVKSLDLYTFEESLCLSNPGISLSYNGDLGVSPKKSLIDQFLSLTGKSFNKAEKDIKDNVLKNQFEATVKIVKSPKAMKELTGTVNPTDEELAKKISKLSEEQLINYRFGLDEKVCDFDCNELIEAIKLAN